MFGIYRDELLELTLSAIASIAVFLQNQGAPIGLLANTSPPLVVPPAASVPHLQQLLESLARLSPHAGPGLLPWAIQDLPPGNTVILAASEMVPDLERTIDQLEDASFHVLLLLAKTSDDAPASGRRDGLTLTPGCDLAARLEGRA
jgi:uncharacterized protein (DUF58 family)